MMGEGYVIVAIIIDWGDVLGGRGLAGICGLGVVWDDVPAFL